MTAADPQHWYARLIPASLRGIFARFSEDVTLTQEQQQAEAFEGGIVYEDEMDERQIDVFQPGRRLSRLRREEIAVP